MGIEMTLRISHYMLVASKVCGCHFNLFCMFSNFYQLNLHDGTCVALENLR